MNTHDAFLRKLLEVPDDDGPRLAYADWLEERGEMERAELLRIECVMAELPADDDRRQALRAHLEGLPVGQRWLVTVSKAPLENCPVYPGCAQRWDQLRLTTDPLVRACVGCQRSVRFCHSLSAARSLARSGQLVVLSPVVPRAPEGLEGRFPGRAADELLRALMRRSTRAAVRRPTLLHRSLSRSSP
jgi:uncharacterized protein (TIGR02996 family)